MKSTEANEVGEGPFALDFLQISKEIAVRKWTVQKSSYYYSCNVFFVKTNYMKAGNPLREIPLFKKKFYRTLSINNIKIARSDLTNE